MTQPVSVIITCYNLERYIAEAIESVLAQDYAGAVEIIVVDDCSTDGSAAIIRSYSQVRHVSLDANGGVLLATIAGIEAATHDRIAFLDGDDVWEPGKLTTVMQAFAANPSAALATHDLTYIGADGARIDRRSRPAAQLGPLAAGQRGEAVREGILSLGDYVWLGSALVVSRSRGDLAGFIAWARGLPDARNTYQDWPLAYWIAALPAVRLDYVPHKLFRYRLHQANYSGDARTVETALRNLNRALNTARAMLDIARLRGLPQRLVRAAEESIAFNRYLIDLNSGRRIQAARGLLGSAAHLRRRGMVIKELARFVAVQAAGPRRFARISKGLKS